jgi:tetratricopeptide (TPR) repeat protein
VPPPTPRQPSPNEAAALRAFEKAHKEFVRGRFAEARNQFRELLQKHFTVVEVAARARTYLAIAETRLKTEVSLPKDADALYDRGVIELNRGDYATAQDFFERALKRQPGAAHIHYGLAATKAQLGATEDALKALEQAFTLQPVLRFRAPQDQDLAPLHTIPEFEQLVTS